jgi:hypothetical protein
MDLGGWLRSLGHAMRQNASSSNMRRVLLFYRHATLSSQTLRSSMTIARTMKPISMRLAILTASEIFPPRMPCHRRCTAWASRERSDQCGNQAAAHRRDRVRDVALGPQRGNCGVDNLRIGQPPGGAWWNEVVRCYGASGEDNGTIVAPANQRSAPCHS